MFHGKRLLGMRELKSSEMVLASMSSCCQALSHLPQGLPQVGSLDLGGTVPVQCPHPSKPRGPPDSRVPSIVPSTHRGPWQQTSTR